MGDFPFFKNITGMRVLVVGGGQVALRRARTLVRFHPVLKMVSRSFLEEPELPGAEILRREFRDSDIDGMQVVIAATDSREVNGRIVSLCRKRGIEINASDDPAGSTFHFPAVVARGEMVVGIGSGGAAPSVTADVRRRIEECLPENLEEILEIAERARCLARERISDPDVRSAALRAVLKRCAEPGPAPDAEETEGIIRRFLCTETD